MIRLIESLPQGNGYFYERIRSEWLAYRELTQALFYKADPNALISLIDGNMIVDGLPDLDEFKSFLKVINPHSICCSPKLAEQLNNRYTTRIIMNRPAEKSDTKLPFYSPEAPEVYNMLSQGTDGDISLPDYANFALDYSFKCHRNLAGAVALGKEAVCVASAVNETAIIITGVAVAAHARGQGLGQCAVLKLCRNFPGKRAFLLCNQQTVNFYRKCEFQEIGTAAFIHFGGNI